MTHLQTALMGMGYIPDGYQMPKEDLNNIKLAVKLDITHPKEKMATTGEIMNYIEEYVCEKLNIKKALLSSKYRGAKVVEARHIIRFLSYEFTDNRCALKLLGWRFYNSDHSTIIHSIETVCNLRDTEKEYKATIRRFEEAISLHFPLLRRK